MIKHLQALLRTLTIFLTVASAAQAEPLSINGSARVGVVPAKPFVFLVPATGDKPLRFRASGLPEGLTLNSRTGIITGQTPRELGNQKVTFTVTDKNGRSVSRDIQFLVHANSLAVTPPLGWNSWYVYGCNINDRRIRDAADKLISTGLAAHGYNYILIDDCWQSHRAANGEIVPKPGFPDMKALADYVHSKGLRIGIYTSPGQKTCGQHPGSEGHLQQDVATYARWGMDFVKYDWCMFKDDPQQKLAMFQTEPTVYNNMSVALKASPRAMVHQICQYGEYNVWNWGARAGGQLWRTNHDVADVWPAIVRNGFQNMRLTQYQRRGGWNDLDMLMVGKSNWPSRLGQYNIPQTAPRPTQLNRDEQYAHISLWSLMASPLIISSDLNQIDPFTKSLLANDEVLAVNQDPLGEPARVVPGGRADLPVITRVMIDGSVVVGLFNLTGRQAHVSVTMAQLRMGSGPKVIRDLWQHTEGVLNADILGWNVAPHGVAFFKLKNR